MKNLSNYKSTNKYNPPLNTFIYKLSLNLAFLCFLAAALKIGGWQVQRGNGILEPDGPLKNKLTFDFVTLIKLFRVYVPIIES